jgi:hypothetical protein
VTRLRYVLGGAVVLGVAAIVATAFAVRDERGSSGAALPKGTLLAASADLFPQSLLFGQTVHVQIEAVVDHRKLDPNRIRLDANWAPYTPVRPMTTSRADVGNYTHLRWQLDLHCIGVQCAPRIGSAVRNTFQPTILRYAGRIKEANPPSATVTWPSVIAWSRLDPIDQERKASVRRTDTVGARQIEAFAPPWHVNTTLAAASYRISPTTLFWGSLAVALALVLGAAMLLHPYLPTPAWLRRPPQLSKLERALLEVERARGRPVEERKALELLAAELRSSGERKLAWTATKLAWSPEAPEPDRTGELTETIRRELAGRTNGHRA